MQHHHHLFIKGKFCGSIPAYVPSLPSPMWFLVHWRSGWSFTPRPEGTNILSPLWPHKESQVLRRAWLAALICYLWLISEAVSHRWWSWAVNLREPTFDNVCVCVLSHRMHCWSRGEYAKVHLCENEDIKVMDGIWSRLTLTRQLKHM